MEFLAKYENREIKANFEEYEAYLQEALKPYRGLVVEDDQIADCKKIRAYLNKAEKAINARKIEIKKAFMKPYTEFENETKKLMSMISECSSQIDEQIKDYEERQKQARYNRMEAWWKEHGILVPFEKVYNPTFTNLSVSEKAWEDHLTATVQNIASDLEVIENMEEAKRAFLMADYPETLSVSGSLRNYEAYAEKQKRIEEYQKPAEELPEEPSVETNDYEIEIFNATEKQAEQVKKFISMQLGLRCSVHVKHDWNDGFPF